MTTSPRGYSRSWCPTLCVSDSEAEDVISYSTLAFGQHPAPAEPPPGARPPPRRPRWLARGQGGDRDVTSGPDARVSARWSTTSTSSWCCCHHGKVDEAAPHKLYGPAPFPRQATHDRATAAATVRRVQLWFTSKLRPLPLDCRRRDVDVLSSRGASHAGCSYALHGGRCVRACVCVCVCLLLGVDFHFFTTAALVEHHRTLVSLVAASLGPRKWRGQGTYGTAACVATCPLRQLAAIGGRCSHRGCSSRRAALAAPAEIGVCSAAGAGCAPPCTLHSGGCGSTRVSCAGRA